jgi:hypothetical protein
MTAEGIMALAKSGCQPMEIRRYALAHVLFATTKREGATVM